MVISERDALISAYRAFVAEQSRLPLSIRELSIAQGFDERSFRAQFSTIHPLSQQVWEDIVAAAVAPVIATSEFPLFTRQEKIVALILAIIDRCAAELPLVEATFTLPFKRPISRGLPLSDSIIGLRRGLIAVLVTSQGDESKVFEREAISVALIAALAYWLTDTTPERLQTEAFVDQIASVVASSGKLGFGTNLAEVGSIIGRTRLYPILSSMLRSSPFNEPKQQSDTTDE
jgi:hypothetical protein